jgi:hypothetical protein
MAADNRVILRASRPKNLSLTKAGRGILRFAQDDDGKDAAQRRTLFFVR